MATPTFPDKFFLLATLTDGTKVRTADTVEPLTDAQAAEAHNFLTEAFRPGTNFVNFATPDGNTVFMRASMIKTIEVVDAHALADRMLAIHGQPSLSNAAVYYESEALSSSDNASDAINAAVARAELVK